MGNCPPSFWQTNSKKYLSCHFRVSHLLLSSPDLILNWDALLSKNFRPEMAKYGICCSKNGNFTIVSKFNIFLFTHWKLCCFSLSVLNVNLKFSPFRASCPSLKYQIKNDYLKISKTLIAGRSNRKDHVNKGRENERKSGEKSAIFCFVHPVFGFCFWSLLATKLRK